VAVANSKRITVRQRTATPRRWGRHSEILHWSAAPPSLQPQCHAISGNERFPYAGWSLFGAIGFNQHKSCRVILLLNNIEAGNPGSFTLA